MKVRYLILQPKPNTHHELELIQDFGDHKQDAGDYMQAFGGKQKIYLVRLEQQDGRKCEFKVAD